MKQRFRLVHDQARYNAKRAIDDAPDGHLVTIDEPRRSDDQNDKMWAMIGDLVKQKPEGRELDKDAWKGLLMHMAGFPVLIEPALDGNGIVVLGYKSSRLLKAEMSGLIEQIYAYGAEHGVVWSEPPLRDAA